MEIAGTLINLLPIQTGQSKNGTWQRQDIILQVGIEAKSICISLWNRLVDEKLMLGDIIKVSVNVESREYNGKWYTDVKAWKIERKGSSEMPPEPQKVYKPNNAFNEKDTVLNPFNSNGADVELPF